LPIKIFLFLKKRNKIVLKNIFVLKKRNKIVHKNIFVLKNCTDFFFLEIVIKIVLEQICFHEALYHHPY